jgi:cytosine/adenosine deaminase-related metal-dependent hydrolase
VKILIADHVLPISSEPISTGAVAINGVEIVAVGTRVELLERFPNANVEDFGEAAILPGFVNCHSHLEITGMRGSLDAVEHDFGAWLLKLNALRGAMSEDDIKAAAIVGAREGVAAGVTCFGDIGRFGFAGLHALKTVGLRGVLYQETEFSADDRTADDAFEQLKDTFLGLRERRTELVEVGLSPHSPYTVSRKLFEKIARFAIDETVKVSIHAAESTDEENLVRKGNGFFRSLMDRFEVEWQSPLCSSIEYLSQTGILETKPLLAHCVTVSDTDIALIANSGTSVAHCPKSNAKFGHGYAPFEKFLDAGIAVGLGSDSVASNNVCDLLEESRFAAFSARNRQGRSRFVSAKDVLTAITLGGARAMRLDDSIGSLEAGKQADLTVVSLAHLAQQPVTDVEAGLVFSSNARDILMTMVAGTAVYRSGTN